jgi:hypothetical protein
MTMTPIRKADPTAAAQARRYRNRRRAVTGAKRTRLFEAVRNKELTIRKAGRSSLAEVAELRSMCSSRASGSCNIPALRVEHCVTQDDPCDGRPVLPGFVNDELLWACVARLPGGRRWWRRIWLAA